MFTWQTYKFLMLLPRKFLRPAVKQTTSACIHTIAYDIIEMLSIKRRTRSPVIPKIKHLCGFTVNQIENNVFLSHQNQSNGASTLLIGMYTVCIDRQKNWRTFGFVANKLVFYRCRRYTRNKKNRPIQSNL